MEKEARNKSQPAIPPTVNNLIAKLLIGTKRKPHFKLNQSTRKDLSSKHNRTILPYVPETLGGPDL
jgi:hypothetical protein